MPWPSDPGSDLHWLAFRYVAAELGGDEAAAFERRLVEDQGAREAVAAAVELAGAVAVLAPDVLAFRPVRRRPVRHALGWMAAGAAACLAAVVGLHTLSPSAPGPVAPVPPAPVTEADTTAQAEVALAWSGLRRDDDEPGTAELLAWLDEPAPGEAEGVVPADPAATAEGTPPSWLLEAASLRLAPGPGGSETREN